MFKTNEEFVDYLYTDFLCGTDSLDPILCKQIIKQLDTNQNLIAHELRKLCLENLDGAGIELYRLTEIEFNKYCKFMLGVNYEQLPDLNNGVWLELIYDGVLCVGKSYNSRYDFQYAESSTKANMIGFVTSAGVVKQIMYPNVLITSIKEITELVSIKLTGK